MKYSTKLALITVIMGVSFQAHSQSVKEIQAEIEEKKQRIAEMEAVNPSMKFENNRPTSDIEKANEDLLVMRRLFEQIKFVRNQASEISYDSEINEILMNADLSVDQKLAKLLAKQKREETEAAAAEKEAQAQAERSAALAEASLAAQASAPRPTEVEKEKKESKKKEVKKILPIVVTFVREFKDGSPAKVGFRLGFKTGFAAVVGENMNLPMNDVMYKLKSVERVRPSGKVPGRFVYRVILSDPNDKVKTLNYE